MCITSITMMHRARRVTPYIAPCTTNVVCIRIRVMNMAFLGQIRHYKLYLMCTKERLALNNTVQATQQSFLYRILAHTVLKVEWVQRIRLSRKSIKTLVCAYISCVMLVTPENASSSHAHYYKVRTYLVETLLNIGA